MQVLKHSINGFSITVASIHCEVVVIVCFTGYENKIIKCKLFYIFFRISVKTDNYINYCTNTMGKNTSLSMRIENGRFASFNRILKFQTYSARSIIDETKVVYFAALAIASVGNAFLIAFHTPQPEVWNAVKKIPN